MASDIGKQILEGLMELIDEEMFWSWFEPSDFYSSLKNAFADEGDDYNCNLCDNEIDGCYGVSKEVSEDLMKEHIFEEHSEEILLRAIQSHFQKPSKSKQISALEDPTDKKEVKSYAKEGLYY